MKRILAAAAATTLLASAASAATFSIVGAVSDGDQYTNIAPVAVNNADLNVTGSLSGVYADIYSGTDLAGVTAYNSVQAGGFATYDLAGAIGDTFTLIWGTIDDYNFLDVVGDSTISGSDVLAAAAAFFGIDEGQVRGLSNVIVRVTAESPFTAVTLRSTTANAFEHSFNPPELAPVPVPAAGFLLVAALGGLGLARRRKSA